MRAEEKNMVEQIMDTETMGYMIMRQQSCRLQSWDSEAEERFRRLRYEAGLGIPGNLFRRAEKKNWYIGHRREKCITEAGTALI